MSGLMLGFNVMGTSYSFIHQRSWYPYRVWMKDRVRSKMSPTPYIVYDMERYDIGGGLATG